MKTNQKPQNVKSFTSKKLLFLNVFMPKGHPRNTIS